MYKNSLKTVKNVRKPWQKRQKFLKTVTKPPNMSKNHQKSLKNLKKTFKNVLKCQK